VTVADSTVLARHVDELLSFAAAEIGPRGEGLRLQHAPASPERLERPLAARNPTGGIDVVFASQSELSGNTSTRLWHYELRGRVWRGGADVTVPGTLYWSRESSVVLSAGARTVVLATNTEAGKGGGIVLARHDLAGWHVRTIPVKGLPYYLTATLQSPDTVLVVFGATDEMSRESNGSHLFQLRIALRDGAASTPVRLQWSGRNAVVRPTLLARSRRSATAGELSVMWGIATQGATDADSLFVMTSPDAGRTWRRQAAASLERPLTHLTSVMLGDGTVATVGMDGGRPTGAGRSPRVYLLRDSVVTAGSTSRLPSQVVDITGGMAPARDALVFVWTNTMPARTGAADRAPYSGLAVTSLRCLGHE
jgi:hypothetical protein